MKESIVVLDECKELQIKKGQDYNSGSDFKQAAYYPRGVDTLLDIIWAKILRMYSITNVISDNQRGAPNFESLEDSAKDCINYLSFLVAYSRGKLDGQDTNRDIFNQPIDNKQKDI